MICPKCNTLNNINNAFCVNCGEIFRSNSNLPPTLVAADTYEPPTPTQDSAISQIQNNDFLSTPTVFVSQPPNFNQPQPNFDQPQPDFNASQPVNFNQSHQNFNPSTAGFNPSIPFIPPQQPPPKSRLGLWIGLGVFLILLLGGGIIGAVFLFNKTKTTTEVLPNHLGIFFQNNEKTSVEEIIKQDLTNAIEGKDKILKDETMPAVESKPNLILYSDGKDIPLSDLKLIHLETIKNDGTMKQIDFKATLVEGKTEMKRLWVAENLAKGKYAFALLDGFFDDGKHKFWVFQIKESDKTDNGNLAKDVTVALKNKSKNSNSNIEVTKVTPTPKPSVAPPVGSRTASASTDNIVIRSAPSLSAQKIGNLRRGQKIYVIGNSTNYDSWKGMEGNWANIQTESGQRGWVFSPLIKY